LTNLEPFHNSTFNPSLVLQRRTTSKFDLKFDVFLLQKSRRNLTWYLILPQSNSTQGKPFELSLSFPHVKENANPLQQQSRALSIDTTKPIASSLSCCCGSQVGHQTKKKLEIDISISSFRPAFFTRFRIFILL
jgi:hypothetical protein